MALKFKDHKKAKANLAICTVYGYVCKLKFAMKFKILERSPTQEATVCFRWVQGALALPLGARTSSVREVKIVRRAR